MADTKKKGKGVSEKIVQLWDGGERRRATEIAREAKAAEREEVIKARPELREYLARV